MAGYYVEGVKLALLFFFLFFLFLLIHVHYLPKNLQIIVHLVNEKRLLKDILESLVH